MKKVIFTLLAIFALTSVSFDANAETTDKRPKSGYNYQKQKKKQARYNYHNRTKIKTSNGGCGWAKR